MSPDATTPPKTCWLRPALAVAAVAAAAGLAARLRLFERSYEFSRAHEDWGFEAILSVLMVLSVAAPFALFVANRRLVSANRRVRQAEAQSVHIAMHDPLTGLANRRLFQRHVEEIERRHRSGEEPTMTALLLDLDRFKPVNDLRGHPAGDLLLCETAARLRRISPPDALVVRLGGDEFVVAVPKDSAEEHGAVLARRINLALSETFEFADWSATLSCSIGIADWAPGLPAAELLRHADQAMYRAKQQGRAGWAHYDEALGAALRDRAALEQDLRTALATRSSITPYFQPIYDITGRGLRAFEILARWEDPKRGFVPPDQFIPLAEEIGLIDTLSEIVLDRACEAVATWPTDLPVSFNLSPRQFGDPTLPSRILAILERHGIPGLRLEIEITERAVLADLDVARAIVWELAAAGVRISLDDFGTGMSSLAILTQLPIDSLKIDRSFIAGVDRVPHKGKIVVGVLALAESLGLEVTAEGIERDEELAFLLERRCHLGQGFLLGRPGPAGEVEALLDREGTAPEAALAARQSAM